MSVYANNTCKKQPTKKQRLELSYLTLILTAPFRLVYQRVWMSKQYLFFALILPWNLVTHFESSLPFRVSDWTVAGIPHPSHGCYMLRPSKSSPNQNASYHAFFPASYHFLCNLPCYRNVICQPTNENMILKGCKKKTRKLMTNIIFESDITLPPVGQPNTLFLIATRNVIG